MKPLIGITANFIKDGQFGQAAHIGGPGQFWQALADDYVNAVYLAGGIPVILPVLPQPEEAVDFLNELDGILFSGGCDLSPLSYGESTTGDVGTICTERDDQELTLARAALNTPEYPVLGICRGCQLLNVALGGSLVLHIDAAASGDHFLAAQPMSTPTHMIHLESNTLIQRILSDETRVNSFHHQCVDRAGDNVTITARDHHGVPECIEVPSRAGFTLGVQWHPEGLFANYEGHKNMFSAFIQAASEYRLRR